MKPSQTYLEYVEAGKRHHASSKTWSGKLVRQHHDHIRALCRRVDAKTLLDYGCGKGWQYQWSAPQFGIESLASYWNVTIAKYDPCVTQFSTEPEALGAPFDVVIATNVLQWVPIADLDWVIARLFTLASKGVYIAVELGIPGKTPYGKTPATPIGWTKQQWLDTLRPHARAHVHAVAALRSAEAPHVWSRESIEGS